IAVVADNLRGRRSFMSRSSSTILRTWMASSRGELLRAESTSRCAHALELKSGIAKKAKQRNQRCRIVAGCFIKCSCPAKELGERNTDVINAPSPEAINRASRGDL